MCVAATDPPRDIDEMAAHPLENAPEVVPAAHEVIETVRDGIEDRLSSRRSTAVARRARLADPGELLSMWRRRVHSNCARTPAKGG